MINNARGSHVSPGVYMKEVDVTYSAKSLGQTTLGLVGETVKGPAFQPIRIETWSDFVEYFGETSPEKFPGNIDEEPKYLKYELPYVAKSYLKESKQLEVCRVLGLSGYDAGTAWALVANVGAKKYVIAILRSKGHHTSPNGSGICGNGSGDDMIFNVTEIEKGDYVPINWVSSCQEGIAEGEAGGNTDPLKINLNVTSINGDKVYPISMHDRDMDYILKVLGTDPLSGSSEIFVEELYDLALSQIANKVTSLDIVKIPSVYEGADTTFDGGFKKDISEYTEKNVGQTVVDKATGDAYKIILNQGSEEKEKTLDFQPAEENAKNETLYVIEDRAYIFKTEGPKFVKQAKKADNYFDTFQSAKTPWLVSEVRGQGNDLELKTLFRFHTISDGKAANEQVKVSIQNIDLNYGTFDVIVRDFYDSDKAPKVLEKFTKCSMMPNSKDYIAFKIGTIDGSYELKSAYIMVEMNESNEVYNSVPCGFLGYPIRDYGDELSYAPLKYNQEFIPGIKERDQYFGFSDLVGIDVDTFLYKGHGVELEDASLTQGFHLDERIAMVGKQTEAHKKITLNVMGNTNYEFSTITSKGLGYTKPGIIFTETSAIGSIYENKRMRKFTVCFYGGYDGWDIYRRERSNTDIFKVNNYKGIYYKPGASTGITEVLDLPSTCNNSDYYAYLAGIRTFSNPEAVDINIFATPGINWHDHASLSQEALSMIEDPEDGRGGDAIYILSAPFVDNAKEAIIYLEESGIDSSYAVTFWPWVKYYDYGSQVYVNLPVTKDVVRNMANIDRTSYPWFSPAGIDRGPVECVRATNFTRLAEEDALYNGMINPVKTFAVDGVKIWGNKTIYSVDSPLNRINVRRLMIRVKKLISTACRSLIFEPNDSTIRAQFLSIVNPILDNVRNNRGIYEYKVIVDDSAEAVDSHTLPAKIMIKPTPTLEYIDLTFVITPTGASFEE